MKSLQNHGIMEPQSVAMFKCEHCHKTFARKHSLKVHVMAKHTEAGQHECDLCGARFDEKRKLERHKQRHSTGKNYKCEVCEKSFFYKLSLSKHTLSHLSNMKPVQKKRFQCNLCKKSFAKLRQLEDHTAIHTTVKEYKCDICGKHFSNKVTLQRHVKLCRCKSTIKSSTEDRKPIVPVTFKQETCQPAIPTSPALQTLQNKYSCILCGRSYPHRTSLEIHIATHTGSIHYRCEICGAGFRQKSSMTRHKQRHDRIRKHKCDLCGKSFIRNHDLTVHKQVHAGIKNHKCQLCGIAFTRRVSMLRHFKSTHKGKIYKCDICQMRFTHKTSLNHHKLRKHAGMKGFKFELPVHKNILDSKQALTEHGTKQASNSTAQERENISNIIQQSFLVKEDILEDFVNNNLDTLSVTPSPHTTHSIKNIQDASKVSINGLSNLKEFQCHLCDSAFSRKQYLTQHMRKHMEMKTTPDKKSNPKRKHQCYVCGDRFAHRRSMVRHRSRHSEIVRIFRCEICGTDFFDQQALAEHNAKHGTTCAKNNDSNILTDAVDSMTQHSTPTQPVLIKQEPPDADTDFLTDTSQHNLGEISATSKQQLTPSLVENNLLTNATDSMTQQTLPTHTFPIMQKVHGRAVDNHPVTQPFASDFSKVPVDQKLYEPPTSRDNIVLERHRTTTEPISIKQEMIDSDYELNTYPATKEFPRNLFEEVSRYMDEDGFDSNMAIDSDRPGRKLKCEVVGETSLLNYSFDSLSSGRSDLSFECEVGGEVYGHGGHKSTHDDPSQFESVVCGEPFTLKNLTDGLMSDHNNHRDVCDLECHVCGGIFRDRTSLEGHISTHNDGRDLEKEHFQFGSTHPLETCHSALASTLECGFCSQIFHKLAELTDHLLQHNETRLKLRKDILPSVS